MEATVCRKGDEKQIRLDAVRLEVRRRLADTSSVAWELERRRVLPVRTVAVREGTADAEVLARMQPGALYRVVYLDGEMRVRREIWENELLRSGKGGKFVELVMRNN